MTVDGEKYFHLFRVWSSGAHVEHLVRFQSCWCGHQQEQIHFNPISCVLKATSSCSNPEPIFIQLFFLGNPDVLLA